MLSRLAIRDFAIIDALELELGPGLTVLTGETGAGKSILVEALGLALGDRADASAVRHCAARAEIGAVFDIESRSAAAAWLRRHDLDEGDECTLRRVIGAEGRSRSWINGRPVTLRSLRRLGSLLVDIHGQQNHQSLVRPAVQRRIVDHHAGHGDRLARLEQAFTRWRSLAIEVERLERESTEREARIDLLRHQAGELDALRLAPGEHEALTAEHQRLAHAGELAQAAHRALELVYDHEEHAAQAALGRASSVLERALGLDPRLAETAALIREAEIAAGEAADRLRRYVEGLESDPARLDEIERRTAELHALARKHRVSVEELPARLVALREELERLEDHTLRRGRLSVEHAQAADAYRSLAAEISAARREACKELSTRVTAAMRELGMPGGAFTAIVESRQEAFAAHGVDRVEFLVAANPGQPAQSLGRTASGGELSRMSLAIEVMLTDATRMPTMIFDEVDAGIGGGTAEIVGRRLRELAAQRQVLCVTHLPQVASQAHHHLRTSKTTDGVSTRTRLERLAGDQRVEELARMLGGVRITARTRAHAQEMIEQAARA
ncbi:MAG TPA: DNA repair protein RecN [Gammaproteobacteria bacterium]|nr:DNA repair protein RecN [Gammaproteobacteria bacterium]